MSSIVADNDVLYGYLLFFHDTLMSVYPSLSFEQLVQLDPAKTGLITANNRLAVFVKGLLLNQLKSKQKTIRLPSITPYKAWLMQLADDLIFQHAEFPIILNETAQHWYWQKVLSKDSKGFELLNPAAAAVSLSQAHRLQTEWNIDVREDELNPEYMVFIEWLEQYQQQIKQLPAWDTVRVAEEILAALQRHQLRVPEHIVLLGFYSLSAYQESILKALQERGTKVYSLNLHREVASEIQICKAKDTEQELQSALAWAQHYIVDNPTYKIALVVPSLQEDVASLRRILSKTFAQTVLEKRWHIAVGRPLIEWSLVRSAMTWFSLIPAFKKGKVASSIIGEALLNTEFVFNQYYADQLAVWDSRLREKRFIHLTWIQFKEELEKIHAGFAKAFATQYVLWNETSRRCADWAQIYRDTLEQFGFPGETSLSSVNYQLCRAFEQALKKFALLDEMLPELKAEEALHLFQQQLQQTSFQAQRHKDVVLDIVGLYETEGGQWDAVWVLGLTDKVLPQMPSPNPYLPIHSQRRCQVMHATPESEMQWAQQIFKGILHSAPRLILSWAERKGEDVLHHTSLLKPYLDKVEDLSDIDRVALSTIDIEVLEDNKGLPKQGEVRGGYGTLERQSKNPLWAYATLRLNLKALQKYAENEVDGLLIGNLLHSVMEYIYKDASQDDLKKDAWLQERLDKALEQAERMYLSTLSSTELKNLCLQRAREIVMQLIEFDRDKREPFKTQDVERLHELSHMGLNFKFKVDRIDVDNDNNYIFIDYKTGSLKAESKYYAQWVERERLVDLQLPLYASLLNRVNPADVGGIAFVNLNRDPTNYVGLWQTIQYQSQKEDKLISSTDWSTISQQWHDKIDALCQEIATGEASNRSLSKDDLKFCDVTPFLRLHGEQEDENE